MIRTLSVQGLRGFADAQAISFAIPENDQCGLTMIVGSNNTGKSTIFEALKTFSNSPYRVGEAVRSRATNGIINLELELRDGQRVAMSNPDGGGQLTFDDPTLGPQRAGNAVILPIPSRRMVNAQHGVGNVGDVGGIFMRALDVTRQNRGYTFEPALASIAHDAQKKRQLNTLIAEITNSEFDWTVDINTANNEYFKFRFATGDHSIEGLGEGVISLILMLLPFVENRHPIVTIDEPELSLHPAWQKRLFNKLVNLSQATQIIIATHSPHFVDLGLVDGGAKIHRTYKTPTGRARIGSLNSATIRAFGDVMNSSNNPHTLGYEMREALFLEDKIIVTEGQEDVVALRRASDQVGLPLTGNLFGWGAGSASMITKVCRLLSDLGYTNVVGVFDANEDAAFNQAIIDHPTYQFMKIPRNDIRDKHAQNTPEKIGLLDAALRVKAGTEDEVRAMIQNINNCIETRPAA